MLNRVPHHLAVTIVQLYLRLDLMLVFFWFATHWNLEPVMMIGPVLGFEPWCTGLCISMKFRVISKKCLEDHKTKAPFSKVAFALRRLVSKPSKPVPAKYGFRKQVGWGVKSLKNMWKICLPGQFVKKGYRCLVTPSPLGIHLCSYLSCKLPLEDLPLLLLLRE